MIKVLKFGGTSVGSIERINIVAKIIQELAQHGTKLIVVVSAMSGVTDQLINLSTQVRETLTGLSLREYDTILSTGEQVSSALLALALQQLGLRAHAWQGWQLPIITNSINSKARILEIKTDKILHKVLDGEIAIVSGFQGIDAAGYITTLGRGGSDTSAVAIAAAVQATSCDIYTDVDGVYSTDPRIVNNAQKIEVITFEEMLELSALGSKVMHHRAVEIGFNHGVDIRVLSSFIPNSKGTLITTKTKLKEFDMESKKIAGISMDLKEVQIIIYSSVPNHNLNIMEELAGSDCKIDMFQLTHEYIKFNIQQSDIEFVITLLNQRKINYNLNENIAKISVIGLGIRSDFNITHNIYKTLTEKMIKIDSLTASEIKISFNIEKDYAELAVRSLHHTLIEMN